VLVSAGDAVILDFEGEPLRPLAERRAKHIVLRDVAGMLRSFSYAAAASIRSLPGVDARHEHDDARRRLAGWEAQAGNAFLEAYFAKTRGLPSLPADRDAAGRLLRCFLLEKALYEISYELANRPDWVAIPLRGVLALLDEDGLQRGSFEESAARPGGRPGLQ
jgi:trehalose synthase-fused probable maltokinase